MKGIKNHVSAKHLNKPRPSQEITETLTTTDQNNIERPIPDYLPSENVFSNNDYHQTITIWQTMMFQFWKKGNL